MCGRARLSSDVSEIKIAFDIPPERPIPNIAPNWNVAPTDPVPVVHYDARAGARSLDVMRWGQIPDRARPQLQPCYCNRPFKVPVDPHNVTRRGISSGRSPSPRWAPKVIAESSSGLGDVFQPGRVNLAIRTRPGGFARGDFGLYRTTTLFSGVW